MVEELQDTAIVRGTSSVVYALGGHALRALGATDDEAALQPVLEDISDLLEAGHRVLMTHGNGPQVGELLLLEEAGRGTALLADRASSGLDVWVAATQGMIGHALALRLDAWLERRGRAERSATLLTRVEVDGEDPEFQRPSKPIGPVLKADSAVPEGWSVADTSRGPRRVVASPPPRAIIDEQAIRTLLDAGAVVICGGGGGIPIVRDSPWWHGAAAVVDKDRLAAELALAVEAVALIITTDVPAIMAGFGTPEARESRTLDVLGVQRGLADGSFPPGSMGPKVEALARVKRTSPACITALCAPGAAIATLRGEAGTTITT